MTPFQRTIILDSSKAVHQVSVPRIILNVVVFSLFVVAVFLFAEIPFTILNGSLILVTSVIYTVFKEFMLSTRTKKTMEYQYDFLLSRHPNMTLYIPLLSRLGKRNHLKSSALFIDDDILYLEAFKNQMLSTNPTDSITVPYGTDFVISSIFELDLNKLVQYTGKLLEYDYHFYTLYEKTINELMAKYIFNERNINHADTSQ